MLDSKKKNVRERRSLIGLMPVRRFFSRSDFSQTTVVSTQNKSQRASHEIFSKLISTLSALIHLDCESPKVPCFCGSWYVRCAIRTLWHSFPPFKVVDKITIYHFHNAFASKSHLLLTMRAHCHRILAIDSVLYFSQSDYFPNSVSLRMRGTLSHLRLHSQSMVGREKHTLGNELVFISIDL